MSELIILKNNIIDKVEINDDLIAVLDDDVDFNLLVPIYKKYADKGVKCKSDLISFMDKHGNGLHSDKEKLVKLHKKALDLFFKLYKGAQMCVVVPLSDYNFNNALAEINKLIKMVDNLEVNTEYNEFCRDINLPVDDMIKKLRLWRTKYPNCSSIEDFKVYILNNNVNDERILNQLQIVMSIQDYIFNF